MRVTWSAQGRRSADHAADHIARERPAAAVAWLEKLGRQTMSLARFPMKGRIVPEFNKPDHREIVVAPYRVLYRVEPTRVYVLAVRHGRQALTDADVRDEAP